jgi:hypothetical protein
MENNPLQYPNLAIKLGNQLSQAQKHSATLAGLPLPIGEQDHLGSLSSVQRTLRGL